MDRLWARDEREVSVDQASDRLAYVVMSFGLLVLVAYRSLVEGVASWELLGLVLLGGAVSTGYRLWRGVLTRQVLLLFGLTALIALIVGVLVVIGVRS